MPIVGLGCMCIALRISLFWIIWKDYNIRIIWVPHHLRLLPAILNIRHTMVSHAVGRGHVYASCFVTPFRLWNAVSLCNNSEVISIFRFWRHVAFNRRKYIAHYRYEKNFLIMSRVLDFEWRYRCYRWTVLSYYYFRFVTAILIFGRRRCRPLSLAVTCMQGFIWVCAFGAFLYETCGFHAP